MIIELLIASLLSGTFENRNDTHSTLSSTQIGLLLIAFASLLTIRRRPDVFRDDKVVDAEHSTSFFGMLSYSWAYAMLSYARRNKKLELDDLPLICGSRRADTMQRGFREDKQFNEMWKSLIYHFRWILALQWTLSIVTSITAFYPQFAMYHLLRTLEAREIGSPKPVEAYAWVVSLSLVSLLHVCLESRMYFIVWSHLAIPARALLSSLIFMKTIVRKDVKVARQSKSKHTDLPSGSSKRTDADADRNERNEEPSVEDDDEKASRQAVNSLLGVDCQRVTDMAAFNFMYPTCTVKLILSFALLCWILGWLPLLAGLGAFSISTPMNIILTKRYTKNQKDLMKQRDLKIEIINEAITGIRQVKLSGLEREWESRIMDRRKKELDVLFWSYMMAVGQTFLWVGSPILFSAVSLMVYSLLHGELSASVAFTVIAIFSAIVMSLSLLPELISYGIEAFVSLKRIEKYLNSPEISNYATPYSHIEFRNACIAWPAESDDEDRFKLRNLSLNFPKRELSVISGQTGSGKNLLLNSILGEAEKLDGEIFCPRGPPMSERFDHKATKGSWIIDLAKAYVSQSPWIENQTFKDNILFGLPYDQGRYYAVIKACALEKDLEIMPDGEMTEIGANGMRAWKCAR